MLWLLAVISAASFFSACSGIAKQSTLSLAVSDANLLIEITPSLGGQFGKSTDNVITASTDNFTGYSLSIATNNSTSLLNGSGDEIESINTATSEVNFIANSAYTNRWGYRPSQYVTTSGGTSSVVYNTDYLPAPSTEGVLLAKTSAANATADTYTVSAGAKANLELVGGTYTYTYVLRLVANSIVYNITYDQNSSEVVANMPSPNPQALTIDGGTPAAESYATLSDAVPTMDGMTFGGWCDVTTTINSTTGNYECAGTTYVAGADYPIDQTADGTNITLYAIWLVDPFPVVWSQMGACEFHGATDGNITGSECADYTDKKFIDTGIALYNAANYQKDYEIHFTIDHYAPGEQVGSDTQQNFVSDKLSTSATDAPYNGKAPGIIVRRNNNNIEIKSTYGRTGDGNSESRIISKRTPTPGYAGTDVSVFRIDGVIYTSVDHGPLIELQDISAFDQQFGLTTWFGAYPDNVNCSENCTAAKRHLEGTLSNLYIKLGDFPADGFYTITLNPNEGTIPGDTILVLRGNAVGELPTPERSSWVFDGWFDTNNQLVAATTVPSRNETYTAHWYKTVAQAQIVNADIPVTVNGTATIEITNAADLEPYTFTSNNPSVATVDPATGVITGIAAGTTTITLTGTKSGETKMINVTVAGNLYLVYFDARGGSSVEAVEVGEGGTISSLPQSTKPGYSLDGWYSGVDGTGTKLTTSTVFEAQTPKQYYAYWVEANFVCKLAPANSLHTETCDRTDSSGCNANGTGYSYGAVVTYGTLADSTTMRYGDAYNCNVNADDVWDSTDERFYYIGMNGNNAKFVYYRSTQQLADQNYDTAIAALPTTTTWPNANIVRVDGTRVARFMTRAEVRTVCNNNSTNPGGIGNNGRCVYLLEQSNYTVTTRRDGIWLEKEGNSLFRIQSATRSVTGNTKANTARAVIEVPIDYVEQWTPAPATYTITFDPHNGDDTFTKTIVAGSALGADYPADPTYTDYIFQGWYTADTGGTAITSATIPDGDTTYHAQWKATVALAQIENTQISVVENYTAEINVVNSAELEPYTFSASDTNIATVDADTGVVTGVAEGSTTITLTGNISGTTKTVDVFVVDQSSAYQISFNSEGGSSVADRYVPIGNAIGILPAAPVYANHVFQGWYTAATGGTKITKATIPDGNTTYHAQWKLDVTQAVISDNDLTLTEGEQITIGISNAASLEPYTFSSSDTNIATVDTDTGVITGVAEGMTNVIMTGAQSNLTKILEVTVTPAPAIMYEVTFNANGGSVPEPLQVESGSPVGDLPTSTRTNYMFFGWYTDDGTFYDEVTPATIVDGDVTYYAKWVENNASFPIVWSETNACNFNGNNNITGDYCTQNKDMKYIDTEVKLFTEPNYEKDFEIGFNIVEYTPARQVSGAGATGGAQATFVNSKQENSANNYPGFVLRRESGSATNIQLTQKWKGDNGATATLSATNTKSVRIVRRKEIENEVSRYKIYYAVNGGNLTLLQDITDVTRLYFDTEVWFGAATASDGTSAMRPLVATLTDMYIKLGTDTEYIINFNPNGGTVDETSRTITIGNALGTLPTPTRVGSYTFDNWYDAPTGGNVVTAATVPNGSITYYAHWTYTSSDVPVVFDVSNNATRGYQNIINNWVQSPTNITTFNEATPINSSTWGNTSALSEVAFWSRLKANFETYNCKVPNYGDAATTTVNPIAWTNGVADCAKPDAYNTSIDAPVDVYLYDTNTSTRGAQVSYAKSDSGVIHNMIPGQTYYWEKSDDSSVYGYVTATSPNGRRWVDTGQIRNTRDLGGLPLDTDGDGVIDGTTEYGKLFRGERLWSAAANTTELTNLGITKEYDLSTCVQGGTCELAGDTKLPDYQLDTVVHYDFDVDLTPGSNYLLAWNAVTDIMTDVVAGKNIYFHCRVGADRTGTVAYLLEGLLGVPDEARYEEYSLTHLSGLYDRTRYYKQKSSTNNLKFVYMMGYVQTTQDIYNWYMANPNADTDLINDFKTAMIGGASSYTSQTEQATYPLSQSNNSLSHTASNANSGTRVSSQTSYSTPLGVSEERPEETQANTTTVNEVALAATMIAATGTVLYALDKNRVEDNDKS
ncbi:InlB B-repeat-containing protein [Candidatus Saccharibacteria bacterium]|nr:InlB B-repeat-containing protein [Candidatus Saccharibacteria bacterium]